MAEVREMWRARGHDPYVIADEVFWNVTADRRPASFTTRPQESRIRLFDAITSYNPYESGRPSHAGYGAETEIAPDGNGLYQRYRDHTGGEVPNVPGVLAGEQGRAGDTPSTPHLITQPRGAGR